MNKRLVSLTLIALLLATLLPLTAMAATPIKYVYTQNGLPLHVRDMPDKNSALVADLPYGTPVAVLGYVNSTWTIIYQEINGQPRQAYVMSRYLVDTMPSKPAPSPSSETTISTLNSVFKSLRQVQKPYGVVVHPARASGFVTLRWAPNDKAEGITKCYEGHQLKVLSEGKNWLQVQDVESEQVGFILKKYVSSIGVY